MEFLVESSAEKNILGQSFDTAPTCSLYDTYLSQPPLITKLVLPGPLLRHKMVGAGENLLQFSNVQHRDRIDIVTEDEGT